MSEQAPVGEDSDTITWLRHSRVRLALYTLREGDGCPLLLLHGLGERAPRHLTPAESGWPGGVHALDFTGHGESSPSKGGGYTAEILMGDADAALAHLGQATVSGRGLGAYVALLIAGARPKEIRGAILRDGPGLAGGGPSPGGPVVTFPDPDGEAPPDPFVMVELARDLRPPDYASEFARQAIEYSGLDPAIALCTAETPEWVRSLAETPGVEQLGYTEALSLYAARAAEPA
jgi:pimeloyl-ACP methyl ester carboxylesterase